MAQTRPPPVLGGKVVVMNDDQLAGLPRCVAPNSRYCLPTEVGARPDGRPRRGFLRRRGALAPVRATTSDEAQTAAMTAIGVTPHAQASPASPATLTSGSSTVTLGSSIPAAMEIRDTPNAMMVKWLVIGILVIGLGVMAFEALQTFVIKRAVHTLLVKLHVPADVRKALGDDVDAEQAADEGHGGSQDDGAGPEDDAEPAAGAEPVAGSGSDQPGSAPSEPAAPVVPQAVAAAPVVPAAAPSFLPPDTWPGAQGITPLLLGVGRQNLNELWGMPRSAFYGVTQCKSDPGDTRPYMPTTTCKFPVEGGVATLELGFYHDKLYRLGNFWATARAKFTAALEPLGRPESEVRVDPSWTLREWQREGTVVRVVLPDGDKVGYEWWLCDPKEDAAFVAEDQPMLKAFAENDAAVAALALTPPNREEAEAGFQRALDLTPNYACARLRLSAVQLDLGKLEEARKSCETAVHDTVKDSVRKDGRKLLEKIGKAQPAVTP